jgi:diketogulonate reductase-like aldo/keto reductase
MPIRHISHHGQQVPTLVYGTAWKEDDTEACVRAALQAGFVGIDTANQRKHYFEAGVGAAVQQAIQAGTLTRAQLFLQTKFTYQAGQDHRLPYDPAADYTTQVQQSFARSLEHLHTDYLDSYVLHGPSTGQGLTDADVEVWHAMEALQRSGAVRQLGVSNVNATQLQLLLDFAEIPPVFVQNRCYAHTQWDAQVRQICQQHQILYQGFSLLTANGRALNHPAVFAIAERLQATLPQVVFRFALQIGMQPLTGTTNPAHMAQDLAVYDLPALSEKEIHTLEQIAF